MSGFELGVQSSLGFLSDCFFFARSSFRVLRSESAGL